MRSFDAIVIGAGPAGCAAAYDLAAAGVRVLVLDRKSFPRVKPCAGALTIKAVKRLRYSIAPVIRFVARNLEVALGPSHRRVLSGAHPIAVMTVRQEFDTFCLQQTLAMGATFETVERLVSISEDPSGVTLRIARETLACRYLVGADGANSQVRRLIGRPSQRHALALEGHVASDGRFTAMRFDFARADGGYGWIFPKGDHLNIGLYTQRPGIALSKAELIAYAKHATGTNSVADIVGYPIGIGGEQECGTHDRIMLVGDAAGMTERLMGEGIHNAIKSGQAAASAIVAGLKDGSGTKAKFEAHMRDVHLDLQACSKASDWFYSLPPFYFGALISHRKWMPLMRGFASGMTFRDIARTYPLSRFYRVGRVASVVEYENREAPGASLHSIRPQYLPDSGEGAGLLSGTGLLSRS